MIHKNCLFVVLIFTLVSCKNEQTLIETNDYKIQYENASFFHKDFINTINNNPININAERISLKEIVSVLTNSKPNNIKFENEKITNEIFKLRIEQKTRNQKVQKVILNKFLESLDLKILEEKSKINSYKISIKDSLKFIKFKSVNTKNINVAITNKDSIKLTNSSLSKLVEVINLLYDKKFSFDTELDNIDYKWKKTSFENLKVQFENDLGLHFEKSIQDRTEYIIKQK